MKNQITQQRWEQAQEGEKIHHIMDPLDVSFSHYKESYRQYFEWLDINPDLNKKSIIEIGPGRIAALLFCNNYSKSYVLEPTYYDGIDHLYSNKNNLKVIKELAEEWDFPKVDEIWLLNLMQHVKDPDFLINKCKCSAQTIRFFEPIDLPTNNEHPFTFSLDDFKDYFGDCVKEYTCSPDVKQFHTARCAYGVWHKVH